MFRSNSNKGIIINGTANAKKTCEFSINIFRAKCCLATLSCAVKLTQMRTGITEISLVLPSQVAKFFFKLNLQSNWQKD